MSVVTGDRYLALLSDFVEANAGALMDGSLVLKLNPVGLHYLQARLDALQELEALRVGAPVDYLRAYIADLGDHRALEQLRRMLQQLGSVKVVSMLPSPARDPTPITVAPFARLHSLELRGCDLSTSAARGLLQLRPILEKLICHNSADALRHLFAERTAEIQGAQVWSKLSSISCSGNGMLLMDESLKLLPVVEALDLSRNRFAKVSNMQKCLKLKFLDVGFNHITSMTCTHQILRSVTKLVLRNNALVSTRGIEGISSLEALDLSHNLISNFCEVESLNQLPSLVSLWLVGNPVTFSNHYRKEALSYFFDPRKLVLDGRITGRREIWAVSKIVMRRLKQRSKYGAFTPPQTPETMSSSLPLSDSGEVSDTSTNSVNNSSCPPKCMKKKYTRVASIQDPTGSHIPPRGEHAPRQPSLELEAAVEDVVKAKESITEAVLDLMQQAESLKREGSSTWLRELNYLLENENSSRKSEILKSILDKDPDSNETISPWQKRRRRKSLRKGGLSSSYSLSRTSEASSQSEEQVGPQQNLIVESQEESATSSKQQSNEANTQTLSGWELDEDYHTDGETNTFYSQGFWEKSPVVEGLLHNFPPHGGELFTDNHAETFRLTEEFVRGKFPQGSPSSPPQFNQDLLHRRQDLERELLRLPLEQEIAPFYNSDSSSETIYSHLSDSSESLYHSPPPAVRHPFTIVHNLQETEPLSHNSDSQESGPAESSALGANGMTSGKGEDSCGEGEKNGRSYSQENNLPEQIVDRLPQPKLKPVRRIVRLDSVGDVIEGLDYGEGLRSKNSSGHRRCTSLGINNTLGLELRRSLSSSIEYSAPSEITKISSLDSPEALSVVSVEESKAQLPVDGMEGGSASYSLQNSRSLEKSGSNLRCHRLHTSLGPVVGSCA